MKKNAKKVLSAIIAASMLSGVFAITGYGEQLSAVSYEMDDNFEDYISTENNTVRNWNVLGNVDILSVEDESKYGTGIKIIPKSDSVAEVDGIGLNLSSATTESQYLDIDFDVNALSADETPAIYFKHNDGNIRIRFANGKIYSGYDKSEGYHVGEYTYTPGEWFHVHMRLNGYTNTFIIDINDENVVSNKFSSWGGGPGNGVSSQFQLVKSTTIGFVDMYKGADGCIFDNISVKKIERKDYKPAQNFKTDFSELKGNWELPDGFKVPNVYAQSGGIYIDDEHGQSFGIRGNRSLDQDINIGSKMLLRNRVTSGKLTLEFDAYSMCPETDNVFSRIYLYFGDDMTMYDTSPVVEDKNGKVFLSNDSSKSLPSIKNAWAKYKIEADVTNKTLEAWYNGQYIGKTALQSGFSKGITGIYFKNQSGEIYKTAPNFAADKILCIDNMSVSVDSMYAQFAFDDNFEGYSSLSDALSAWEKNADTVSESGRVEIKQEENHGKVFYLGRNTTDTSKYINKKTPHITSGTFNIKTAVKLDGPGMTALINFADVNTYIPAVIFDDGKISTGIADLRGVTLSNSLDLGTYTDGVWYNVEASVNVSDRLINAKVTDESTGLSKSIENVPFSIKDDGDKLLAIDEIRLQQWSWNKPETAKGVYYDDVSLSLSLGTPSLDSDSIKLIDYTEAQEFDLSAASPAIEKIDMDFGTAMSTVSLLNNVTLTDVTNSVAVDYNAEVSGNVFTIGLPDMLKPNTSYVLSASAECMGLNGENLGSGFEFPFATGDGKLNASFDYFRANSFEIKEKADLNPNEIAEAGISYFNSNNTDTDMYLIFSYYKEGKLIDCNYRHIPIQKDVKNISLKYLERINPAVNDADCVKVFLWNGLNLLVPLDINYTF